jgi:hypothetical protein
MAQQQHVPSLYHGRRRRRRHTIVSISLPGLVIPARSRRVATNAPWHATVCAALPRLVAEACHDCEGARLPPWWRGQVARARRRRRRHRGREQLASKTGKLAVITDNCSRQLVRCGALRRTEGGGRAVFLGSCAAQWKLLTDRLSTLRDERLHSQKFDHFSCCVCSWRNRQWLHGPWQLLSWSALMLPHS